MDVANVFVFCFVLPFLLEDSIGAELEIVLNSSSLAYFDVLLSDMESAVRFVVAESDDNLLTNSALALLPG